MNTDYLRYFSTLAELQHYGNAAKALNISQPGLSHAIHSLEKDYGLPLFEKTGRNVRLSPYGLKLKKIIDVILNNLDELEQTISDFHREDKIIRIASVYPLAGSFIPELIQSCSVKFPFAIYNGMTPDILHGLENMTYDLGFCSGQPSSELFEYCPVQKSYVGIVVPKGHELMSKEAFTFRDITTYPQIFFTRTSPMRKLQEQIYKDYQISALSGSFSFFVFLSRSLSSGSFNARFCNSSNTSITFAILFYIHFLTNVLEAAFIAIRFCSGCTYFSSMVNQSVAEAVSFFWWYNLPQCHLYFFRIFHLVYKSDSIT